MNTFIFDVDGTLTPSRQPMNAAFQIWFEHFVETHSVILVTGSDYSKTLEQVGKVICEKVVRVYNCSGSDVWENGVNIYTEDWSLPEDAHAWLSERLAESEFPKRTGLHFEHRPGMVNFSIVGRNANLEERAEYVAWDKEHDERNVISFFFNGKFLNLEARPGGETGIDISQKGRNKSQILNDLHDKDVTLHFFGDRMDENGNDYPLMKSIIDNDRGYCYNVKNWEATWNILQNL